MEWYVAMRAPSAVSCELYKDYVGAIVPRTHWLISL